MTEPVFKELKADWQNHHIEGYARAAMERGQSSHFSAPLLSHIKGNLWTGGCIGGVNLGDKFDYIVSLYPWEKYTIDNGVKRYEVMMYDSAELSDSISEAVEKAVWCVGNGPTLIHCQAGLNRSGLIAASVLRETTGMSSREAIDLLREKRSPMVLCNETFETYLLGLDEDDS